MIEAECLRHALIEHLLRFGVRRADRMVMLAEGERRRGAAAARRREVLRWRRGLQALRADSGDSGGRISWPTELTKPRVRASLSHNCASTILYSVVPMHFKPYVGSVRRCCSALAAVGACPRSAAAAVTTASGGPRPTRSRATSVSAASRFAARTAGTAAAGASTIRAPTRTCRFVFRSSPTPRSNFDKPGTPNYVVIQATEPELFKCPFVAVTNHGRAFFAPEEVEALARRI